MALAPRTRAASDEGGNRSSVKSADGKAAQRERNKDSDTAHLTKRSGSSGKGLAVRDYPGLDWDTVAEEAEHLCNIAAMVSHVQTGASGTVTATLNIPLSYLHEIMAAHVSSRGGMLYLQVHHVPLALFDPTKDDGDGD